MDAVLKIRFLQIRNLQIRNLTIINFRITDLQITNFQIKNLQIRILQIRNLQIRIHQIYFFPKISGTPRQTEWLKDTVTCWHTWNFDFANVTLSQKDNRVNRSISMDIVRSTANVLLFMDITELSLPSQSLLDVERSAMRTPAVSLLFWKTICSWQLHDIVTF